MANIKGFFDAIGNLFDFSKPIDQRLIGSSNPDKSTFLSEASNVLEGAWSDYTGQTANRENIEYQKEYNEQVFNRADTQYQRTVADLRAAGLSSQLAAGAPSTVAGQSAAPQRAVGNESQALERLIGMITSMKQTEASVNLTNAQADKARAETSMVNKELGTYGERHALDMALKRSQADYNAALTSIAMIDGQYKANYWDAQVNDIRKSTEYRNSLIKLAQKDMSLRDAQIEGQYQSNKESRARVDEINQRVKNLKEEFYNIQADFYNKLKEGKRLDAQTELLLKQASKAAIESDVQSWNLDKSKEFGLRTTDSQTRVSVLGNSVDNVQSLFDWNKEWTPLYWITSGDYPWKN